MTGGRGTGVMAQERVRVAPVRHRRCLIALAAVSAVTGYLGAVGLALMFIQLGDEVTGSLPWENTMVAGISLAVMVAIPMTVLTVMAARGDDRTDLAAVVAGWLLVLFIVGQVLIIETFTWFQPVYLLIGLAVLYTGHSAT